MLFQKLKHRQCKHRQWLAFASLVFLALALTACGGGGDRQAAPDEPDPGYRYRTPDALGDGWVVASADDLGVSGQRLEHMMNSLAADYAIVDSIAIAYRGTLVLDETVRDNLNEFDALAGNDDLQMHVLFSASKSIASILVGIAIDAGFISGIDAPFLSLFPYASYAMWDDRKTGILLEDALTMRMGLEWNEWDPPYSSPDNAMLRFYEEETDFSKALLDLPMVANPGTTFAYNTPATVSIGQALENNGPLSLVDFVLEYLIAPLDIADVRFFTTPTGLPDLGRGLFFRTRDFLKFGQLFVSHGIWNGRRIVGEDWVHRSAETHVTLSWADPDAFDWKLDGYGYLWWTGHFDHEGRTIEAYAARGYGQQVLMIAPELELVVAVNSSAWEETPEQTNQVFNLIQRFVLPALP